MRLIRLLSLNLVMLAALPAAGPTAAQGMTLEPISFRAADGTVVAAERGSFAVPESRRNPHSRQIRVSFVRFRSTNPRPGPPIVYLAGGPGGTGSDAAAGPRFPIFMALRAIGDVIAFDQRGTGRDSGLPPCSAAQSPDLALPMTRTNFIAYYRAAYQQCAAFWRGRGIAIEGYNTLESAADIEELRRRLGVRRIHLWAISYGTHLALATTRAYPRSIDRVALASVEGLDQTVKLPARIDAALERLARATPGGPELLERMRRVHRRLDTQPVRISHQLENGSTLQFTLTAFPVRLMAASMVTDPSSYPRLAQLYAALDAGAYQALAPAIYDAFWRRRLTLHAMPVMMDLASGISRERVAVVESQRPHALFDDALNFPLPAAFGTVSGIDLGPAFRRPLRARHHTLMLSGSLDVRTPMEEQVEATAGMRNLTRIVVENAGHNLYETHPAIVRLLVDFFSGRAIPVAPLRLPAPSLTGN